MLGSIVNRLWEVLPCTRAANGRTVCAVFMTACLAATPAAAISIELRDVAPDRIERQRAAIEGRLPLPGTPDIGLLPQRLAAEGVKSGAPIFMRIFKESSELEVWIAKAGSFVLLASYPICHWSGTLGPKLREGDKQTPEGFYTITSRQMRNLGRWPRSMNLGFPNVFDTANGRDGSYILMHGGCSSVGCFAMTNPVMTEIYGLAKAALSKGQRHIPIHVFPFRMTEANLARHGDSEWASFWANLKQGYDSFERTSRPPRISVCKGEYVVEDAPAEGVAQSVASSPAAQKARRDVMLGAVRRGCPAPKIATAESERRAAGPDQSRAR